MVTRYHCDDEDTITEQPNGRYVEYEDYAALEAENAKLREALRECVEFMEADCREECEWPCPDSVACGRKKIFLKAREVLGDASSR